MTSGMRLSATTMVVVEGTRGEEEGKMLGASTSGGKKV
jgi:hypothetical protein